MAPAESTGKCSQFISYCSRSNITGSTHIPNPYGCKAFKAYLTFGSDHKTEFCLMHGCSCSMCHIIKHSTYHHSPLNSGILPWLRQHVDMAFTIFRQGILLSEVIYITNFHLHNFLLMYHLTRTNISAENQQAIIKSHFIPENTTPQEPLLHILRVRSDILFLI